MKSVVFKVLSKYIKNTFYRDVCSVHHQVASTGLAVGGCIAECAAPTAVMFLTNVFFGARGDEACGNAEALATFTKLNHLVQLLV